MNKTNPEDQHQVSLDVLTTRYKCNARNGLDEVERDRRSVECGRNILTQHRSKAQLADEEFWDAALPNATLVRVAGKLVMQNNYNLVVGDVCVVTEGDIVGADMRILEARNLTVDMSRLIGERDPKVRSLKNTNDDQLMTANMLLSGSFVTSGSGVGLVVATGNNTIMGRTVSGALNDQQRPLLKSYGKKVQEAHKSLREKCNVWLRNTEVLPVLRQSPTYIILPLRGVISYLSRAQVASLYLDGRSFAVDEDREWTRSADTMYEFFRALALANACHLDTVDTHTSVSTNYCETTMFDWMRGLKKRLAGRYDLAAQRSKHPVLYSSSYRKALGYQFAVFSRSKSSWSAAIEGQPEAVLAMCSHEMKDGKATPMDAKRRAAVLNGMLPMCDRGESVLAIAEMTIDCPKGQSRPASTAQLPTSGATFLGFVSLTNPIKKDVPATLERIRENGTRVVFITSDHPNTADAILRQCGIQNQILKDGVKPTVPKHCLCTGEQLSTFLPNGNPNYSHALFGNFDVLTVGRCRPEQKLWMVELLQKQGEVCAAIGKWSNDAPLLAQAKLGVVLRVGPHYMKENADIIVADNRLSSLFDAVQMCRSDKLKKAAEAVVEGRK